MCLRAISIHALRGEGDDICIFRRLCKIDISIHALRGEGDTKNKIDNRYSDNFNPRPPWGGRHLTQREINTR